MVRINKSYEKKADYYKKKTVEKKADPAKNTSLFGNKPRKAIATNSGRYVLIDKKGKKHYYAADNTELNATYFWKVEHEVKNNKAYGADYSKKFKVSGSRTGRYYIISKKDNRRHYFSADGTELTQAVWLKNENAYIGSKGSIAKHLSGGDVAKSVGKGILNDVKSWFTDKNGHFSLTQTAKTVAIGALIAATGGTGLLIAGVVGAAVASYKIYNGVKQINNANSSAEAKAGVEETSAGGFDLAMSVAGIKGGKGAMGKTFSAVKSARKAAQISGKSRFGVAMDGLKAGFKANVPSPKETLNNVKKSYSSLKETITHPVRTVKSNVGKFVDSRRAKSDFKSEFNNATTKEDYAILKNKVAKNEDISASTKEHLLKNIDKKMKKASNADLTRLHNKSVAAKQRAEINNKSAVAAEKAASVKEQYEQSIQQSQSVESLNALKKELPDSDPMKAQIDTRIKEVQEKEFNDFKNELYSKGDINSKSIKERFFKGKSKTQKLLNEAEDKFKDDPTHLAEAKKLINDRSQLLEDIDNLPKHPTREDYEDIIARCPEGDKYTLNIVLKKLKSEKWYKFSKNIKSADKSNLRGEAYRKLYANTPEYKAAIDPLNKAHQQELDDLDNDYEASADKLEAKRNKAIEAKKKLAAQEAPVNDEHGTAYNNWVDMQNEYASDSIDLTDVKSERMKYMESRTPKQREYYAKLDAQESKLNALKKDEQTAIAEEKTANAEYQQIRKQMDEVPQKHKLDNKKLDKLVDSLAKELKKNPKFKYKTFDKLREQAREELLQGKHIKNLRDNEIVTSYKKAVKYNEAIDQRKSGLQQQLNEKLDKYRDAQDRAYNATIERENYEYNDFADDQQIVKADLKKYNAETDANWNKYYDKQTDIEKKLKVSQDNFEKAKTDLQTAEDQLNTLNKNKAANSKKIENLTKKINKMKKDYETAKDALEKVQIEREDIVASMKDNISKMERPKHHMLLGQTSAAIDINAPANMYSWINSSNGTNDNNSTDHDNELIFEDETPAASGDDDHNSELKDVTSSDTTDSSTADATADDSTNTNSSDSTASTVDTNATTDTPSSSTTTAQNTTQTPVTPNGSTDSQSTPVTSTTDGNNAIATVNNSNENTSVDSANNTTVSDSTPAVENSNNNVQQNNNNYYGNYFNKTDDSSEKPILTPMDQQNLISRLSGATTKDQINDIIADLNKYDISSFSRIEVFQRLVKSKVEQINNNNYTNISDSPIQMDKQNEINYKNDIGNAIFDTPITKDKKQDFYLNDDYNNLA